MNNPTYYELAVILRSYLRPYLISCKQYFIIFLVSTD